MTKISTAASWRLCLVSSLQEPPGDRDESLTEPFGLLQSMTRETKQNNVYHNNNPASPERLQASYLEWPGLSAGRPTAPPAARTSSPGRWEATCQLSCDQNPESQLKPAVRTDLACDRCGCLLLQRLCGGGVPLISWFFSPWLGW